MILITDSGSSKCNWCFAKNRTNFLTTTTVGINPATQTEQEIRDIISNELIPTLKQNKDFFDGVRTEQIHFYGAGCTENLKSKMQHILQTELECKNIAVYSDMLGAARSLFQKEKGIACILGTGANSCLYDGTKIIKQTPALGYILGDEGSGAYLGKKLIQALFKGKLSPNVVAAFQQEYSYDMASVIEHTYRMPRANRFLASLTKFLYQQRQNPQIHELICHAFDDFIFYNLKNYYSESNQVAFIGSIAFFFQEELTKCLELNGFHTSNITQDPMEGLLKYHFETTT